MQEKGWFKMEMKGRTGRRGLPRLETRSVRPGTEKNGPGAISMTWKPFVARKNTTFKAQIAKNALTDA